MINSFASPRNGKVHRRSLSIATGMLFSACLIGAAIPLLTSALENSIPRLLALPAGIALLSLLLLDRPKFLMLVLVFRSSGDQLFDVTRFSLGSYEVGIGGLINAFVIMIVALMIVEKPGALPRRAAIAWAGFLLAALVAVPISPVKGEAIRTYLALLSYFAVFVGAFHVVRSPADFRLCVKIVLWSSVIPALYALVELGTGGAHRADGFRIQGTFAHPNIFAFYLVLVISLVLYMLKSSGKALSTEVKVVLLLYTLLLLAELLLTKTRSAWLACLTIFVIYGLIFERRYLAYATLVPLLALLIPGVQDRLLDLSQGNEYVQYARLNSFAWRRLIWESGLQWMRPDHYPLGYGLESFKHFSLVFFPLADRAGTGSGAHNVYVQLLFETGIVGLAAYLALVGWLLWCLRALPSLDRMAAFVSIAAIVAYLIISLSDNMLRYLSFNWYFWFVVGAACAAVARSAARTGPAPPAVRA